MALEGQSFVDALLRQQRSSKGGSLGASRGERVGGGPASPKHKSLNNASHMQGSRHSSKHGSAAGGRSHVAAKAKPPKKRR
jgi:hypothetical protein